MGSEEDKINKKVGNDPAHDALDPNDSANLPTRLEQEKAQEKAADADTPEVRALKKDPTAPARMHGNEPSRGAKIDAQLQAEEEAELERKGKA